MTLACILLQYILRDRPSRAFLRFSLAFRSRFLIEIPIFIVFFPSGLGPDFQFLYFFSGLRPYSRALKSLRACARCAHEEAVLRHSLRDGINTNTDICIPRRLEVARAHAYSPGTASLFFKFKLFYMLASYDPMRSHAAAAARGGQRAHQHLRFASIEIIDWKDPMIFQSARRSQILRSHQGNITMARFPQVHRIFSGP